MNNYIYICYSLLSFRQIHACRQTWTDTAPGNYILNSWRTRDVFYLSDLSLAQWMFYRGNDSHFPHRSWWRVKNYLAFAWTVWSEFSLIGCFTQKNTNFHFHSTAGGWWRQISFHPISFCISSYHVLAFRPITSLVVTRCKGALTPANSHLS